MYDPSCLWNIRASLQVEPRWLAVLAAVSNLVAIKSEWNEYAVKVFTKGVLFRFPCFKLTRSTRPWWFRWGMDSIRRGRGNCPLHLMTHSTKHKKICRHKDHHDAAHPNAQSHVLPDRRGCEVFPCLKHNAGQIAHTTYQKLAHGHMQKKGVVRCPLLYAVIF